MNALAWLALGLAVLLVPVGSPAQRRADRLAARGRLARRAEFGRRLPVPRAEMVAVAACATVAAGAGVAGGLVLGVAAGTAAATVSSLVLAGLRGRAARRREADLLTAIRLIAAELDAGAQPTAAFTAASTAPTYRDVFRAAAAEARAGDDPALPGAELAGLRHAWRMAAVTGAPLAAVVGRVAGDLGARAEQRRAVLSGLAAARSSAVLLAVLPVLGVLLGTAMHADPLEVLLGTPSGRVLCLVGVLLDSAGVLWTARLTARAARA